MSKLFFWSITSALAGFLFGFDTIVISGAEKRIQELWGLSDLLHGFATASALYGTVLGALMGGRLSDKFGRQKVLLWIGILYLVSAVGSAFAPDVYSFILARFIGGIGVGVSTIAAPLYISEIAPAEKRGRLTGLFQFNIVFGVLIAYLSNVMLIDLGEHAWRWMLGVEAFPALVYAVVCKFIPESPRWLIIQRGNKEEATRILQEADKNASRKEIDLMVDEIDENYQKQSKGATRPFWVKKLKKPILLAIFIAFFNQLSGINAVIYFAPRIFELTGLGDQTALLKSAGIGVTNLIFTFIGLWMIDRMGRRALLYIGSIGYVVSLGLVSWAFHSEYYSIVPACIFAFVAAHAIGQGAVIWVFIAEVFPNEFRARGQSLGCSVHWIFAALLTTFFPKMVKVFDPSVVFAFFAVMMVIQLVWVWLVVPETKGVSLESLEEDLSI